LDKILLVEDDMHISEMLCHLLRGARYDPTPAFSGTEALLVLAAGEFSLVLLDLMLPGKTGEEVLKEIRKTSQIPVIALTARTDKETTVELLKLGADDYVNKPFDNAELLARIDVQLRRAAPAPAHSAKNMYKNISLDEDGYDAVSTTGEKAGLSKREFEILQLMLSSPQKVFTKNNLYESIWGGEFFGDDNTVNVHISKLRAKLAIISPEEEYIQTVWGIGYKMKE